MIFVGRISMKMTFQMNVQIRHSMMTITGYLFLRNLWQPRKVGKTRLTEIMMQSSSMKGKTLINFGMKHFVYS